MGRDASPGTPCTFAPRRGVCPFRSDCVRSRIQYIPYIYVCVCVYTLSYGENLKVIYIVFVFGL